MTIVLGARVIFDRVFVGFFFKGEDGGIFRSSCLNRFLVFCFSSYRGWSKFLLEFDKAWGGLGVK